MNIYNKVSRRILLQRILISLGIILFIRIGSFLPVPGINHTDLVLYIQTNSSAQNFINNFSDDGTVVIGLFTLNIFPYINASIIIQFITAFSPSLSKLQKEGDLNARRSINRLTRLITLIWAIIQSFGLGLFLRPILFDWNLLLLLKVIIWLTTGAMIVLWLSELITDFGLGNGASLLIYTNIISSFPNLYKTFLTQPNENLNTFSFLSISILITLSLFGIVLLQYGVRRIKLISSKQLNTQSLQLPSASFQFYIPLKLNQSGVMPIILTTAILVLPSYVSNLGFNFPMININYLSSNLGIFSTILYWISYYLLILGLSSFYSTVVLNPKDIADQLQKMSVTIPNIRPGVQTAFYLKKVMQRLNIIGSSVLAILATLPNLIEVILNVPNINGLSATSLLIVSGVLVDISREIDDIIYSNIYKKETITLNT